MLATSIMRAMPVDLCIAGRKRDWVLRALDLVWRDPVRTFAEIAASGVFGSLDDVQLIKIDVEGAEVEAIEGMSDVFANRNFRPDIWCEVRGDTAGRAPGSYRKVRELLARHGYIAHDLKNGCDQPLDEHDLSTRVVYDLLFTVPDRR